MEVQLYVTSKPSCLIMVSKLSFLLRGAVLNEFLIPTYDYPHLLKQICCFSVDYISFIPLWEKEKGLMCSLG